MACSTVAMTVGDTEDSQDNVTCEDKAWRCRGFGAVQVSHEFTEKIISHPWGQNAISTARTFDYLRLRPSKIDDTTRMLKLSYQTEDSEC